MTERGRCLEIALIDDSSVFIDSFSGYLSEPSVSYIPRIPIQTHPFLVKKTTTHEQLVNFLRDKKPDIVITDFNVKPLDPREIGKSSKQLLPTSKVILASMFQNTIRFYTSSKGMTEGIFDADWEKSDREAIWGLIKKYAFKPLSLGVIGVGNFGFEIVDDLKLTKEVSKLKFFSRKIPGEHILKLLEYPENISSVDSLEEVLEDIDVLIYSSSKLRGHEVVSYFCEDPTGRKIIFAEYSKIKKDLNSIKQAGYNGLTLMCSNMVELNIELGVRLGLSQERLAYPFLNDVRRMKMAIKNVFGDSQPDLVKFLIQNVEQLTTGTHRNPRLVIPNETSEFLGTNICQIEKLQNEIEKQAREAQQASNSTGLHYTMPPSSVRDFCIKLAHYEYNPITLSRHIDLPRFKRKGVVALPCLIDYTNGISVIPEQSKLQEIGFENLYQTIGDQLKEQQEILDLTQNRT